MTTCETRSLPRAFSSEIDRLALAAARGERTAQLAEALDDALADPAAWWNVITWLTATDRSRAYVDLFTGDLMARPGWALLDSRQQAEVLDLGIAYLSVHHVSAQDWAGHQQITIRRALPDWSAVYLLTTLARHDPGRIRALNLALWRKWAPAIIAASNKT